MPAFPASRAGGLLAKFSILLSAACIALGGLFFAANTVRTDRQCEARLARIYRALELYEIERGALPNLAFYPDDPREGADSLRGALENYGVEYETCICPAAPGLLREAGQTYLWNVALSGQKMPRGSNAVWLLTELTALSRDVPRPHWGGSHVLYSDGRVETVKDPRAALPGL